MANEFRESLEGLLAGLSSRALPVAGVWTAVPGGESYRAVALAGAAGPAFQPFRNWLWSRELPVRAVGQFLPSSGTGQVAVDDLLFSAQALAWSREAGATACVMLRVAGNALAFLALFAAPQAAANVEARLPEAAAATADVLAAIRERTGAAEGLERYPLLADHEDDVVYAFRFLPEPRFEYVSASVERLVGYTPEDHYRDPDLGLKLVHADDRALIESLRAGGIGPSRFVARWLRRDGVVVRTEHRVTPLFSIEGEVVALEGVARARPLGG
ncbi:MAG TPA: PAS domain-containing protein [Dehalococcoidia bacterium]|nr:PAS domain-containing protein [Dehalococcoidia bacterium]